MDGRILSLDFCLLLFVLLLIILLLYLLYYVIKSLFAAFIVSDDYRLTLNGGVLQSFQVLQRCECFLT